jgi:hypothetical protein
MQRTDYSAWHCQLCRFDNRNLAQGLGKYMALQHDHIGMPLVKLAADTHSNVIQFTINSQSIDSNSVQFCTKPRVIGALFTFAPISQRESSSPSTIFRESPFCSLLSSVSIAPVQTLKSKSLKFFGVLKSTLMIQYPTFRPRQRLNLTNIKN